MIRFQALGVRFALPLLSLIAPLLALRLGMRGTMGALALAVGAHELAHLAAAKAARVEISEIRLMPFGGSARIENPYRLSPEQLIAVAAAGPAMNLGLALLIAALAQWSILRPDQAAALVQPNLMLMLFNLLPVLPLDGGRILYALLSRPLGEPRALKLGLWLGRALAAALLGLALASGLRHGRWNLTLILAAVFILSSERDERSALINSRARRLEETLESDAVPRPARIYQLDARTSAVQALRLLRPREQAWFVLTEGGTPCGLIDGRSIVRHITSGSAPDAALGQLRSFRLSAPPDRSSLARAATTR